MIRRLFLTMGCAVSLTAQITSSTLQKSFGVPETVSRKPLQQVFIVEPELEMRVSYSAKGEACQIEIPLTKASREEGVRILKDAVPNTVRGEKWSEVEMMTGLSGLRKAYYQHIIITEDILRPGVTIFRPKMILTFKKKSCGWTSGPEPDPFDVPPSARNLK